MLEEGFSAGISYRRSLTRCVLEHSARLASPEQKNETHIAVLRVRVNQNGAEATRLLSYQFLGGSVDALDDDLRILGWKDLEDAYVQVGSTS